MRARWYFSRSGDHRAGPWLAEGYVQNFWEAA
jgi:hypothetical protein